MSFTSCIITAFFQTLQLRYNTRTSSHILHKDRRSSHYTIIGFCIKKGILRSMHHISSRLRHKNFLGHSIGALVQEQHSLLALIYTFSLVNFSIIKHWTGIGINTTGNVARSNLQEWGARMIFSCSSSWSFSIVSNILLEGFPPETPFPVLFHLVDLLKARLRWSARQGELSIAIKPHPCLVKNDETEFQTLHYNIP